MSTLQVTLQPPTSTNQEDITARIINPDNTTITSEIEDDTCVFKKGDISLSLDNTDGHFSTLWTLPVTGS
jgi:hypothetical protein